MIQGPDVLYEVPRTLVHVFGGLLLAALGYTLPGVSNVVVLAAVFLGVVLWEVLRVHVPLINAFSVGLLDMILRPWEKKGVTGTPAFTAGALLAFILFSREVALLAMSALIFGDRAAVLVGKGLGRIPLGEGKKTLEGSLGCFVFTLAAFLLLRRLVPAIPPFGPMTIFWAALLTTATEALPHPFNDNFTIPLAVGLFFTVAANLPLG